MTAAPWSTSRWIDSVESATRSAQAKIARLNTVTASMSHHSGNHGLAVGPKSLSYTISPMPTR